VNTSINLNIIGTRIGSNNWVDFDNDNDLDFFYIGYTGSENGKDSKSANVFLYENKGNDVFTQVSNEFPGLYYSSSDWGDINNDGYIDLIISGSQGFENFTKIYYNVDGTFTDANTNILDLSGGGVDLGDYDNDGDMDILISGSTSSPEQRKALVYENINGVFTVIDAGLTQADLGDVKWVDYDNDGYLDIFISGFYGVEGNSGAVSEIYKNMGNSQFQKQDIQLQGMYKGEVEWGDLDKNGYLDLVLLGKTSSSSSRFGYIYYNSGNGIFTKSDFEITGLGFSSIDLGDFDGDSDLDILVSGELSNGEYSTQIYRNEIVSDTPTKVNLLQSELKVFPNPVSDFIQIVMPVNQLIRYDILSLTGQSIISGIIQSNSNIDLENLNSGTYLLKMNFENRIVIKKITKQ